MEQMILTLSRNRNSLEFDAMPLPALHAANVDRMRQRFEEAKQRMNLMHQRALDSGLIARGGGAGGSSAGLGPMTPTRAKRGATMAYKSPRMPRNDDFDTPQRGRPRKHVS